MAYSVFEPLVPVNRAVSCWVDATATDADKGFRSNVIYLRSSGSKTSGIVYLCDLAESLRNPLAESLRKALAESLWNALTESLRNALAVTLRNALAVTLRNAL